MSKILILFIFTILAAVAKAQPQAEIVCGPNPEQPAMPCYDLGRYLAAFMHYPADAYANGIDGKVVIRFVVTEKGIIDSPVVTRPVHPLLDAEALRLVRGLPPWIPATRLGIPARMYYSLPVPFRIE